MRKIRISDDTIGFNLYSFDKEMHYLISYVGMDHPNSLITLSNNKQKVIYFYNREFIVNVSEWDKTLINKFGPSILYDRTYNAIGWLSKNEHIL